MYGGKSKQLFSTSIMTSLTSIMAAHQKSSLRVRYACDKAREQIRHKIAQFCRFLSTTTNRPFFQLLPLALRAWAGVIRLSSGRLSISHSLNAEKARDRSRFRHKTGFHGRDRRRTEHVGGSGGMLPREIYVLVNAFFSALKDNLSRFKLL